MMLYTYPMQERLTACLLLIGLLGQSCGQLIEPEIRELSEAAYTEGKLTCKEVADKEESNSLVLAAPPYRPMTSPNQCAQMYEGELQNSPYDLGQGGSDKGYEGEGGRERVANPTEWPYLFHSQLEIRFHQVSSPYGGSGVLVGPQHILTAAHNVYQQDRKVWADQVVVRLALHDNVAPYGAIATSRIYACKGWTGGGDGAYDLALLVLDKPIGYQTGWCGLLGASSQELKREEVHITGYPGDKGYKQLWGMSGFIKEVQPERLIYGIATSPGQSGSGIWLDKWGSPYVVGVHARGGNALANIGNMGVRLSYAKAKQVIGWINQTLSIQETFKKNLLQAKSGKEEKVVEESASIKQGVEEGPGRKEGIKSSLLPSPLKDKTVSRVTIDALVTAVKEGHSQALLRLLDLSQANAYVQFSLGKLYEEGEGVRKDLKQAVGFYEESASQGYAEAQFNLGLMYKNGQGVAQDYQKAVEWWEKAATQGYAEAQNNLGVMYRNGKGVSQDYKKALEWYLKAANLGDAHAQYNLGAMYDNGKGVAQDLKKALEWYEKAAEKGYAKAQNNLGSMYENGKGVAQDYQKAVEWYQKAAEQEYADAQFNLGWMYRNGQGVSQDYKKAVEWYEKAANQGYATAQNNLGLMYQYGKGVAQDAQKAVEWYEKAANQGIATAQNNLGLMYKNGQGVAQDDKKAVEWYEKAANQGHAAAQDNLGDMYKNGEGVSQDYKKAVEWYLKAANQGHAAAQDSLGDRYYYGEGVSQDYKKAVEWYEKAANQGYAYAQNNLGLIYQYGKGVAQDAQKAVEWYEKAANQGIATAKQALERLKGRL